MVFFFSALSVAVGLAALFTNRADVSTWVKAVLYVAELALLIVSIMQLGWWGFVLTALALVGGTMVTSVRLAMRKEHLLVSAAAQGVLSREEGERLYDWAKTRRRMRGIGPIVRCHFILALSHRGRDESEAWAMLEPLGMLHVIYGTEPHALTEKFDRIMRVWDEPAHNAERVADRLVAASKQSPAKFEEMLDALAASGLDP